MNVNHGLVGWLIFDNNRIVGRYLHKAWTGENFVDSGIILVFKEVYILDTVPFAYDNGLLLIFTTSVSAETLLSEVYVFVRNFALTQTHRSKCQIGGNVKMNM